MATAAEIAAAKAAGFIAPTGSDMIRDGDNAITENAAAAVRELNRRPLRSEALQYGKKWTDTDDLDTWWHHGAWGVTEAQGMPPGVDSATMIQIEAGNGAWQRLWISFGIDAGIWLQWGNQINGVWNTPTKLDTSDNIDSALAHELRVQDLQRRRARTTTAKGVVVFVLDHGYSAFMDKAWPDLQARGFPVTWALNTKHPAAIDTGDTGIDWTAIKNLAAANADTLEIAAHSANHGNVSERKNLLEAAIIGHKTELENLTGQRVDSWVQPGATLGRFVKDNPGSPDDYADTRAGRMIAATYAAATGYIQSPRTFKLDARPDLGIVGNWLDTGPGNVMTYINSVATNGGYTIVRLHPQYMDRAGYITRAQWRTLLDQIKALTDAGTVEVMTLRDASVATPSTAHTHPIGEAGLEARLAPLERDTGWRSIPTPALTAGKVLLRRLGDVVYMTWDGVVFGELTGTQSVPGILPQGFRSTQYVNFATVPVYGPVRGGRTHQDTAVQVFGLASGDALRVNISFPSTDPFPDTLPGVPA